MFCSQLLLQRQRAPWARRVVPSSSFPRNYTQHLSIRLPKLCTVSVRTWALSPFMCTSVSKMGPKVSEKPKRTSKGLCLALDWVQLSLSITVNEIMILRMCWTCQHSLFILFTHREKESSKLPKLLLILLVAKWSLLVGSQ